jgi:hypothetical protein
VHREAERAKVGYEQESAIATISGQRLKQSAKAIYDPSDWKALEENIEDYMKQRIKMLRVDYIVTYIKTRRHSISGQTVEDDLDNENTSPTRKKQRTLNVFPELNHANLEFYNEQA